MPNQTAQSNSPDALYQRMSDMHADIISRIPAPRGDVEYENSPYITVGGPTGFYRAASPWDSDCEYAILTAACGTAGAGSATITTENPKQPALGFVGGEVFGQMTSGSDPLRGMIIQLTQTNTAMSYEATYVPLPRGQFVYVSISVGAGSAFYVTLVFRRKIKQRIGNPSAAYAVGAYYPTEAP